MDYSLKTDNTNLVVSISEIKQYMADVDFDVSDDVLLEQLIKTATIYVENYLSRSFLTKTFLIYCCEFISSISLLKHKLINIVEIKYLQDGNYSILDPNLYDFTDSDYTFQKIFLNDTMSYISTDRSPKAIVIEAQFGFGQTSDKVPEVFKNMIKRMVAFLYNNRGDCLDQTIDINNPAMIGLKTMLDQQKILNSIL